MSEEVYTKSLKCVENLLSRTPTRHFTLINLTQFLTKLSYEECRQPSLMLYLCFIVRRCEDWKADKSVLSPQK